jgi:ribosomal protein S18 acetylase RimI-like enzyme
MATQPQERNCIVMLGRCGDSPSTVRTCIAGFGQRRSVSYCVCWLDIANQIGYFEPVGTRPAATGRGFGRAVIREGFRRLRERGMVMATVTTAFVNKPALALYASAGFDRVEGEHTFVKSDPA